MWESIRSRVKILVLGVFVVVVTGFAVYLHAVREVRQTPYLRTQELQQQQRQQAGQSLAKIANNSPGSLAPGPHSAPHFSVLAQSLKPRENHTTTCTKARKGVIGSNNATWKKKMFCYDYLVDTYPDHLPMCGGDVSSTDQVKCSGSVYSTHMARCSYRSLAMRAQQMIPVIRNDVTWKQPAERTINLLQGTDVSCQSPSMDRLAKKTDRDDFQIKLTQHLTSSIKLPPSMCDVWINKTAFFHTSNAVHIYFRFLDLYNVHQALLDYKVGEGNYVVVRIGNAGNNYLFPNFDKALFPGTQNLEDLSALGTVCFREVVFAPRSYQSVLFRCKMDGLIRQRCFGCSGIGLHGSPFHSFRARVLKACNITDLPSDCKTRQIVLVSRKPYKRWRTDDLKKFQRILRNEDEIVDKIHKSFPNFIVKVAHMEELDVCEQVRLAAEADVMLGVHGAGLVHFWWLRDGATALELEPSSQKANPSFRMLTTLTGRKYLSERVAGTSQGITVNIDGLLKRLKQILKQ